HLDLSQVKPADSVQVKPADSVQVKPEVKPANFVKVNSDYCLCDMCCIID
ncbi:8527_t:CDS:1, partial [Cetraspora pellucida]